ncbi:MAG: UDP-N-acetylmuramoyl-L-alanyl-D-glutamate--2,6-diaminopimelate ligase [Acidobacteria bacterium]|nr:UDP-N-acetylmuramoyl-L-alanyl-D-glutamate--2,6-diaminopimelate ligase [Acidobacteriota bacterium]
MDLIAELPITTAGPLPDVSGIAYDSRQVEAGDLFVALVGERCDGRAFAPQAVARGAVAVLGQGGPPSGLGAPWLQAENPRALLGLLAARLYGHPDQEMAMLGVTGTNGKSTVVELLRSILETAGRPSASIGTLGYRFGELIFSAERTTPEASDLFRMLRAMRDAGAEAAAMEVSSHALALARVAGVTFDLAIFTNLSRDHFDFHTDFEDYFRAKRSLFGQLKTGAKTVVNIDDAYGRRLVDELPGVLTFGSDGDVAPLEVELDEAGLRGALSLPSGILEFQTSLLGRFNLENILAAVAGAEALGVQRSAMRRALAAARPLPGRLEPVEAGQPFPVLIDYAHTDAALAAALRSVREFTRRRVLVVFGCGGDRDPGKRVLMGRAAGRLADAAIATSDNPRSEDPQQILVSVAEGLRQSGAEDFEVVVDRREALRRAVARADEAWVVLVAGKGHEEVQIIGDRQVPFSDRVELTQALEERFGAGTPG